MNFDAVETELGPVDGFENALGAGRERRLRIDVDDVPGDRVGFDHGPDLGDLAVVFLFGDLVALLDERLEIGLALALLIGAAPRYDRKLIRGDRH